MSVIRTIFHIISFFFVLCFLLGNSQASEFYRQLGIYPPMKMEETDCSETLAYKIQTPGNYPKERIRFSEHGESLKSKICSCRNPFFFIAEI